MPLSSKDKQTLKEKYKAQRRAMWAGKGAAADSPDSDTVADEVVERDRRPVSTMEPDRQSRTEVLHDAVRRLREARGISETNTQSDRQTHDASPAPGLGNAEDSLQSQQADDRPAPDEAELMKEKIREQREETWEGQFSVHSRRRRQHRKASKGEREFWESSEEEGETSVLTWKLALGVVGGVIVLIGVGVLLGYWFAS
ncbi:MAG: hypothetical protein O7E52_10530 [Candidatus Poribacteria bacterium]|nr:hypothetical protein [Candidatus Poribacteria bacterium]